MEEDTTHTEEAASAEHGLPPSNTGHQQGNAREENDRRAAVEHFNLVPPSAPFKPISFTLPSTGHTRVAAQRSIELNNPYDIVAQQGSGTDSQQGSGTETTTDSASDQYRGRAQPHRDPSASEVGTPFP